jgi:NAD+ kinase
MDMGPQQQPGGQPGGLAGDDRATLRGPLPRSASHGSTIRRIAIRASRAPAAREAAAALHARYPTVDTDDADVVVALGGDGFMLAMLHEQMGSGIPVYGMHRGSVGFLMNEYREDDLFERLHQASRTTLRPLTMQATTVDGDQTVALAINEVSLHRSTHQAAKVRVSVDGVVRVPELIADGILVSTPAGSTAYNLSAHGPILPVDSPLLALTPVCAFRPRRWRGALLPCQTEIRFDVLEAEKRPVAAAADGTETTGVQHVLVREDPTRALTVLFDDGHNLDERILQEQFTF